MPRLFALVALALLLQVARHAEAAVIYVDNQRGDDRNGGTGDANTRAGGPVRSLARALELAKQGDHIVVANTGVPYYEGITLAGGKHSGFGAVPLVIEGNGAVLDGSAPVPDDAWTSVHGSVFRFRPAHGGGHQLFQRDGKPAPRKVVDPSVGQLPALAAGEWCSHDGAIYFNAGSGALPGSHELRYASLPVGILLYHVHDLRIVDLTVQGFHRFGVHAHDGVRDASIGGLVLRGNGIAGLMVGGSSQLDADGCLVGNNVAAQVKIGGYSALGLKLCELLENPAPAVVREGNTHVLYIDGKRQ